MPPTRRHRVAPGGTAHDANRLAEKQIDGVPGKEYAQSRCVPCGVNVNQEPHAERDGRGACCNHRPQRAPANRIAEGPHAVELGRRRADDHRLHGAHRIRTEIRERASRKRAEREAGDVRDQRGGQHDGSRRDRDPGVVRVAGDSAREQTRFEQRPGDQRDKHSPAGAAARSAVAALRRSRPRHCPPFCAMAPRWMRDERPAGAALVVLRSFSCEGVARAVEVFGCASARLHVEEDVRSERDHAARGYDLGCRQHWHDFRMTFEERRERAHHHRQREVLQPEVSAARRLFPRRGRRCRSGPRVQAWPSPADSGARGPDAA